MSEGARSDGGRSARSSPSAGDRRGRQRHRRRCLDAPPRFDAGSRIVQRRPRRRRAARRRLSPCCYHGVVEDPWTPGASCPLGRRDRPSSGGYNARGTSGRQDRANRLRAPTLAVRFETAVIGPPPGLLRGSHPMRISYPRCASVAPQVFDRPPVGEQPYGTGPSPRCRAHP